MDTKQYNLAIIPGRFQSPIFHAGYKQLLEEALKLADNVVFVVCHSGILDEYCPLPPTLVKTLLRCNHLNVEPTILFDKEKDEDWSKDLDSIILKMPKAKEGKVCIIGSRDTTSVLYKGQFTYESVKFIPDISSTIVREAITKSDPFSLLGIYKDIEIIAAGIIWGNLNKEGHINE